MNTTFLLLAQYEGRAVIPIETVCADYFAPLTLPNLRRKIATGEIGLPLIRMETDNKKTAQGVHLQDLAEYIDSRRAVAVKERDQLCGVRHSR
ncbi:pyocin activator PrtN family protein [Paraburkholderia heleia]|uniref:pyocin activator PrtN family protein n=1 Tax=Paraburkholderia heleia TaxID=634127 RepID=UPI0005A80A5E|nr:pyocin activator PrtN family protein [Paraburkholderia heleia]